MPSSARPGGWEDFDPARRRNIILAALVAVALLVVGLGSCQRSSGDPLQYIQKTYQRESTLDESAIEAYVAASKTPNQVATEISAEVSPLDRRTSTTDDGETVFLQYSKRIVAISKHGDGSKILIGDYRTAHSHWFVFIGGWWGSSPGYSGGGSSNRGGGVGGGK